LTQGGLGAKVAVNLFGVFMLKKVLVAVLLVLIAAPVPALGESPILPWLYRHSDYPVDERWTFGEFKNGLRWGFRHNQTPKGQVSIRIRIATGSLMERPDQCGYAHFIEHMVFRKTQATPVGEVKRIFERLGADFGNHLNARTEYGQTVYQINLPNGEAGTVDTALRTFAEMMQRPVFDDVLVGAERGVILSEERARATPGLRIYDRSSAFTYDGLKLGHSLPIGTPACLNKANAASLRAFYQNWYRPDLTVVSVSGDTDRAAVAKAIDTYFGSWARPKRPAPSTDLGRINRAAAQTIEIVEPDQPVAATMIYVRPYVSEYPLTTYFERDITRGIAADIINRRFEKLARSGKGFRGAAIGRFDAEKSANVTTVRVAPIGDDWASALDSVRAVLAEAAATPPTAEEVQLVIANYRKYYIAQVESGKTQQTPALAEELIEVSDGEGTLTTEQAGLTLFETHAPRITPATVHAQIREYFQGAGPRLILVSPKPGTQIGPQMAAALSRLVTPTTLASTDKAIGFETLAPLGTAGTIVERRPTDDENVTIVRFANGARAAFKPTKLKDDEVRVVLNFGTGLLGLSADAGVDRLVATSGGFTASGLGAFDEDALDRLMSGERVGMGFSVGMHNFVLAGSTNAANLEKQLRLFGHRLQSPRWDGAPIDRIRKSYEVSYDSLFTTPERVMGFNLPWLQRSKDPRWKMIDRADIARMTPAQFRRTFEPTLSQGPIELVVVGDFDLEQAIKQVAATIGAMPSRVDSVIGSPARDLIFPASTKVPVALFHTGRADQGMAVISWPYTDDRSAVAAPIAVLEAIFRDRLNERLRNQSGKSYGPIVSSGASHDLRGFGAFSAGSSVNVADIDLVYGMVRDLARQLTLTPVDTDTLERARGPIVQNAIKARETNGYWVGLLDNFYADPAKRIWQRSELARLKAVSAADVRRAATLIFAADTGLEVKVLPEVKAVK
jgi:zinc protease